MHLWFSSMAWSPLLWTLWQLLWDNRTAILCITWWGGDGRDFEKQSMSLFSINYIYYFLFIIIIYLLLNDVWSIMCCFISGYNPHVASQGSQMFKYMYLTFSFRLLSPIIEYFSICSDMQWAQHCHLIGNKHDSKYKACSAMNHYYK